MTEINIEEEEIDSKFFTIYLSYCWNDQVEAKKVAQDISGMGFNILFDEDDDDKLNLDPFNSIYKCDLILVCLSSSYLKCFACQNEAKYFFEKKIPTLTVSVEENFQAEKSLSKILAGRQYKQLMKPIVYPNSKSDLCTKLNQVYTRIQYHEILRKREEKRKPNIEDIEKRRLFYENKFKELLEKEKELVKEEKEKIEKLFVYDEFISGLRNEVPIIYRWYMKYPNVTLSNLVPFSTTGDINDASFPYPVDSLEKIDAFGIKEKSSSGRGSTINHLNTKRTVNLCWLSAEYNKILAQKKTDKPDEAHKYFAKLIERNYRLDTSLGKNNIWRNFVGFPGPDRNEEEMEKRIKLDTDLSVKKKRRIQLSNYFNDRYKFCPSDTFCKFAELQLKNRQEFEEICTKNNVEIRLPNF